MLGAFRAEFAVKRFEAANLPHAADVESVLYEHSGVQEASVAGVPHPVLGEDVTPVYEYEPGTWGPEEANQLIAGDGSWSEPS